MSAATPIEPGALDPLALRTLIVERLASAPREGVVEDWRIGAATPERRAELRRFFPVDPVHAAVLVPLVERPDGLTVLLTQRAGHLKKHPGQISFPGGRVETDDPDVVHAALRETEEEVGLDRAHVTIAGLLPDHLIVTGFRVTPVVGFVRPGFRLRLDPTEVDDAFEVPLAALFDPRNHVRRIRRFEDQEIELTDLPFEGRNIWGATAGMLLTFYRLLRGEDA
ncbi:MAG: CoA pyrophosphatase [Steroidobacteraceae bacterium]|jgi:8-oxo-dGTP pyrophosphatase MutT (NUDIX family)|nr:CoA pyrophosphatase [Steroidobacteraceae bacterium]